jgi:hypothetical protein
MADIWKNWSEKEKQGFYACIAVDSDPKALQNLLGQFRKTLGRESTEKIKNLYYKAILSIKKICDNAGIDLERTLPEPKFFDLSTFDMANCESGLQVKKDFRALSKNRALFSVLSKQNCMKTLEMAISSKQRNKSMLGIQALLKPTEGEVVCQFCGKIRKKWGSTYVLK